MDWRYPNGSVTRGVVIEDGAGNKLASFGGGAGGSNASVGANGSAAPSSATEVGFVNALGNLAAIGPSNPLPITAPANLLASDSGAATPGAIISLRRNR
ncbi:hypothetical protein CCR94_21510 [Rhodoblastus sphagnicola]|uniref:Uncharacterized protein n=1 Tax=Rhodoblastus sphagnicola TaxID=333368 RepID=A0A2S6MWV2_9HYPH|nr:hypothetical protein [Rhodoblastus sphagnicola]MBB4200680.1 hypothetical protein [Rhodoblastus sphagnicola]PPQ26843.1 hypothetical protein CCR94_21510 [Rhodoblastus sphagnicola]